MPWGKPDAGDVAKPDGVVSGRMKPPQPLFVRLSLVLDPQAWRARLAGKAEHTARRSGGVFVKPFCSAPVSAPDARKRGRSAAASAGLRCGGQHHAAKKEVRALQPLHAQTSAARCLRWANISHNPCQPCLLRQWRPIDLEQARREQQLAAGPRWGGLGSPADRSHLHLRGGAHRPCQPCMLRQWRPLDVQQAWREQQLAAVPRWRGLGCHADMSRLTRAASSPINSPRTRRRHEHIPY